MSYLDFPLPSKIVDPKELKIVRAQDVAFAIQTGYLTYVTLFECRVLENSGLESVIFDVEVELGQRNNVYDIRKCERVAVIFSAQDEAFPEVWSLRNDFPQVPHTNLRDYKCPISFCLYDQPFSEVKLFLTPTRFIERIRQWLADTAKGRLHGEDQPLEPLFLEFGKQLIIPFDLFKNFAIDNPTLLEVHGNKVNDRYTFIAEYGDVRNENRKTEYVAVALKCQPQQHGIIHRKPTNFLQLHEFTSHAGLNLLEVLRTVLQKWQSEGISKSIQDFPLMLIIAFPKIRNTNGEVEATDLWAFSFADTLRQVGIEIGVWEVQNGVTAMLLPINGDKRGDGLPLEICKTMYSFSREMAARQNGLSAPDNKKIVMVGIGALGSQMFMNLVRSGYGQWTLVDHDIFLPHNLARHALSNYAIGCAKSDYLAWMANMMINGEPIAQSVIKDILKSSVYSDELKRALAEADIILDCTASSAATRYISRDIASSSRRFSLFLNPSGTDSVLLAEDSKREIPLDQVEIQYYRLLVNEKKLEGHLTNSGKQFRYGNSCSDVNTTLSQEFISLHSAICSRAFRHTVSDGSAKIKCWRADPTDFKVNSYVFTPNKMIEIPTGDWVIYTDEWLIAKIYKAREGKLPNETGGVLVGSFDMQRRIIYVVETLLSPPDSKEWPTGVYTWMPRTGAKNEGN